MTREEIEKRVNEWDNPIGVRTEDLNALFDIVIAIHNDAIESAAQECDNILNCPPFHKYIRALKIGGA